MRIWNENNRLTLWGNFLFALAWIVGTGAIYVVAQLVRYGEVRW